MQNRITYIYIYNKPGPNNTNTFAKKRLCYWPWPWPPSLRSSLGPYHSGLSSSLYRRGGGKAQRREENENILCLTWPSKHSAARKSTTQKREHRENYSPDAFECSIQCAFIRIASESNFLVYKTLQKIEKVHFL